MSYNARSAYAAALVAGLVGLSVAGCGGDEEPAAERLDVVHVPEDATLAEAGDLVADGGVIMIAPGTYTESLQVSADDVTVRGEDRNGVVLDGELTRSNGIVATGERVAIENLTVRNFLQNGVLVTGVTDEDGAGVARGPDGYLPDDVPDPVPGYLVQYVTAQNNGLYGIYAFNRTGGEIRDNLASGGSDSGIYIGQCADCNALVADNVVTFNAVGFELANASHVTLINNRVVQNRIGFSVLSNYLEAHGPSVDVQIAGNVIADNNEAATPEQANGAFGIGIGLGGTVDATVRANLIAGNDNAGVWISSSEDFAPTGNSVTGNEFDGPLAVAYAASSAAPGADNCIDLAAGTPTLPADLTADGCAVSGPGIEFNQPAAPAGISFADVALTAERPGLDDVDESPRAVADSVELPDVAQAAVPDADLLAGE